jgi:hypothetical protein
VITRQQVVCLGKRKLYPGGGAGGAVARWQRARLRRKNRKDFLMELSIADAPVLAMPMRFDQPVGCCLSRADVQACMVFVETQRRRTTWHLRYVTQQVFGNVRMDMLAVYDAMARRFPGY